MKVESHLAVALALLAPAYASTASPKTGLVAPPNWDPKSYKKSFASCSAVDRSGAQPRNIRLKLAYLDLNRDKKKTLILVHGWPSLWTTYRNQIAEFSDYRLIVPEIRGYGDSEHPKDLYTSNTMFDVVNDIMCLMDAAKVNRGVCVGNDFGAQVCWEAGRSRPDRFIGVFNVGIPYVSAAIGLTPNAQLAQLNKNFTYQVYLSTNAPGAAKELDADPLNAIRSCARVADSQLPPTFLQLNNSFLKPWYDWIKLKNLRDIPVSGIMTDIVERYMVASYKKQGFYNTFNGYQMGNRNLTFQFETKQGNFTLPQPTFTLFPTRDPVADWVGFAEQVKSHAFLKNYRNATIATAHWPHEEQPVQFNSILRNWLRSAFP